VGVWSQHEARADLAAPIRIGTAAGEGVPMIVSDQASVAIEDCAAAMGDAPRWFTRAD
jgi:hypothetical protein